MKYSKRFGFTLLEILLVIAAIGILAAIVIVAINPQRQLAQVRDTERRSDINTLHQALEQYLIEEGEYPSGITNQYQDICREGEAAEADDCVDLSALVPTYIAGIPEDGDDRVYRVAINPANDRISILASPELEGDIAINRLFISATGGTETVIEQDGKFYRVHSFTEVGESSLEILYPGLVEYLVVAGGGGGGARLYGSGGGGGGGLFTGEINIDTNQYEVIVGSGGLGGQPTSSSINILPGDNGGDSSIFGIVAVGGGGGGGAVDVGNVGRDGGSGGGSGVNSQGLQGSRGLGIVGQGNDGGNSFGAGTTRAGGGGGGAGGPGQDAQSSTGGSGGAGIESSITGDVMVYATGGRGGDRFHPVIAQDGTNSLGEGGEGAGTDSQTSGGSGGSGIVIVRYEISESEYQDSL